MNCGYYLFFFFWKINLRAKCVPITPSSRLDSVLISMLVWGISQISSRCLRVSAFRTNCIVTINRAGFDLTKRSRWNIKTSGTAELSERCFVRVYEKACKRISKCEKLEAKPRAKPRSFLVTS